jgi:hypothetical protein
MKARQRRADDLDAYRKAELERQVRHRAKKGQAAQAAGPAEASRGALREAMSRATLPAQVTAVIEECLENLDRAFRLSRATLERQLVRRLSESQINPAAAAPESGQAGP